MKSLVLAAALACANLASAAVILEASNGSGGMIRLTDEPSKCSPATKKALTGNAGEADKEEGCWKKLDDETIMVYWPEVGIYFYPVEGFEKAKGWL